MSNVSGNMPVRKSEWFRSSVAISGWVAAALMGLLNLPGAINSFKKELPEAAETTGLSRPIDKRFAGAWAKVPNCAVDPFEVGDLTEEAASESSGLDFRLGFEGSRVSGEIMSDALMRGYITPEVAMVGRASGATARMRVVDWIGGKATTLAEIEITRVGDDCLKFATIGESTWFPSTAFLTRQSEEAYQAIPRESELMNNIMRKISKKRSNEP